MVYTCCVPGSVDALQVINLKKSDIRITLFGFPSDENLRKKKWVAVIPQKEW